MKSIMVQGCSTALPPRGFPWTSRRSAARVPVRLVNQGRLKRLLATEHSGPDSNEIGIGPDRGDAVKPSSRRGFLLGDLQKPHSHRDLSGKPKRLQRVMVVLIKAGT